MHKNNWDISRERDEAEAFAEKCERFRELEPKPIDDQILEHIVELATEQDRLFRMRRFLAGIWGSRAKNDVDNDWRTGAGRLFPKPWDQMTLEERVDVAERVAQDWEEYR
jgi:hypothetical protein